MIKAFDDFALEVHEDKEELEVEYSPDGTQITIKQQQNKLNFSAEIPDASKSAKFEDSQDE